MAKNDNYYFETFVKGIKVSKKAAEYLNSFLENFDTENLENAVKEIHAIEHSGDALKHDLVREVSKAFITPLDREDILKLSHTIDDVTDSIEDILVNIYIRNIRSTNDSVKVLSKLLVKCCDATVLVLEELKNFKKSKTMPELLIAVNKIEEEADELYHNYMRTLYTEQSDALRILQWSKIYKYFEQCFDACEDVADIVESIIIENT